MIKLTLVGSIADSRKRYIYLTIAGIQAMQRDDKDKFTIIKHQSHNNGGYNVEETIDFIIKISKIDVRNEENTY